MIIHIISEVFCCILFFYLCYRLSVHKVLCIDRIRGTEKNASDLGSKGHVEGHGGTKNTLKPALAAET